MVLTLAGELPVLRELNKSKPSSSFCPFVVIVLAPNPVSKPDVLFSTVGEASHGDFCRGGWDWSPAVGEADDQGSLK